MTSTIALYYSDRSSDSESKKNIGPMIMEKIYKRKEKSAYSLLKKPFSLPPS